MHLKRIYYLLLYHKARQFFWRAYLLCTPQLHKVISTYTMPGQRSDFIPRIRNDVPNTGTIKASSFTASSITLLNRPIEVSLSFDWNSQNLSAEPLLWQFHLHYHDYLNLFFKTNQNGTWDFILRWINTFPLTSYKTEALSWHPYVISKRVPIWLQFWNQMPPPKKFENEILSSIKVQLNWLELRLERDLGGNHLWENALALIVSSCFLGGETSKRWNSKGIIILDRCIKEQINLDGEHFEKSPSYTYELLQGLNLVSELLKEANPPKSKFYKEIAERMLTFLKQLSHPTGCLPLFGDSSETTIFNPELKPESKWLSDYYLHSDGSKKLIFDAGNIGPDFLPAHSHSDLLTFELSVEGKRLFVDSGTYCYEGNQRNKYRGSKAHNVLTIDSVELADCWSSFRMGRRGHIKHRYHLKDSLGTWILASHDAYKHLGIHSVSRLWYLTNNGPWFSLHLVSNTRSGMKLEERIQLHPTSQCRIEDNRAFINCGDFNILLESIGSQVLEIENSCYSPDFYKELPNHRICLTRMADSRLTILGWTITSNPVASNPKVWWERNQLCLSWVENGSSVKTTNSDVISIIA